MSALLWFLVGRALVLLGIVVLGLVLQTVWAGEFLRSWRTLDIGVGAWAAWLLVDGA